MARLKQSARLVAKGYWGVNRPAYSFALTGTAMMADAEKYGRIAGLTRYRDDGKKDSGKHKREETNTLPVGLARGQVFPDTNANKKAGWSNTLGGADYLEEFPRPFVGSSPGLGHIADTSAAYQSNPIGENEVILANTGHMLRLLLKKPPESVNYPLTIADWDTWQLQIGKSGAVLQRRAATWTTEAETALIILLGVEEPTLEQYNQIEELKRQLYADTASLDLEGDQSNSKEVFYQLEFFPEIFGKVTVYCNGKFAGAATHSDIVKTRAAGVLWNESSLAIRRNGGHFYWQTGYAWHGLAGEIRYPYHFNFERDPLENFVFNAVKSQPPGTNIYLYDDEDNNQIVAEFTTSNQRVTPLLYLAQAYLDAGIRGGDDYAALQEVVLDTDVKLDNQGKVQIYEVEPVCEGDMRRAQFNVQLRDLKGGLLKDLPSNYYEALENRVCDLYLGGHAQVTNGIVRMATPTDWGSAQANQPRPNVTRPNTEAQLEVCDPWTLLEEHELEGGELVGDGLRLGVLFRRGLRRIGTPYSEMSGISDGTFLFGGPASAAGRILPKAAIDEEWAVVNSAGSLADFFYYLVERFGMGRILYRTGSGVWTFGPRPTSTRVLNGHEVHFSSDPSQHHPDTWPGRYAMVQPIDLPRDTGTFYNYYRVVGAEGSDDEPLVREEPIWESINRGGGTGSRKFIGRVKKMRTIRDTNLRTADDVVGALRSAKELHGFPPRFLSFETYFHSGLFVGDRVKADGGNYIVRRISGGSWRDDRMQLLLQEVGY